jgi:protein-S-isoprenylcysteine O-methyltransferase Ste14
MMSETPFRIALAAIFLLTGSIAGYYRLRAAEAGETVSRAQEGYLFALVLRLAGLALGASTLAYLLSPGLVRWAALPLPAALRWGGGVVAALASGLMWWTLACLGRNLTDTVVTRAAATLATEGPYRWVRHPYYVAAALLMGSATLLSANGLIGATSLLVLALLAARTPKEERMLIERFGDDYRRYMERTGRYGLRWRGGARGR